MPLRHLPSSRRPARRRPFTLTELVLVITAVVLLGGVIIPALYDSYGAARQARCEDNLRDLADAVSQYESHNGNYLPIFENGWLKSIAPLMSNADAQQLDQTKRPTGPYECPSQSYESNLAGFAPVEMWHGSFYGLNQHISSNLTAENGQALPEWGVANTHRLYDPSLKVLLADSTGGNALGNRDQDPTVAGLSRHGQTYAESSTNDPASPFPALRHYQGKGNFIFVDNHVELLGRWPALELGPMTRGYLFWHAEHWYPGSGLAQPVPLRQRN